MWVQSENRDSSRWVRPAALAVIVLLVAPSVAHAKDKANNVTASAVGYGLSLGYEHAPVRHFSAGAALVYWPGWTTDYRLIGAAAELTGWWRSAHSGAFATRYVQVQHTSGNDGTAGNERILGSESLVGGVVAGWRWQFSNGFNVGLGMGIGYARTLKFDPCPTLYACEVRHEGWHPRPFFDVGLAF